jgi:hypothetical protein
VYGDAAAGEDFLSWLPDIGLFRLSEKCLINDTFCQAMYFLWYIFRTAKNTCMDARNLPYRFSLILKSVSWPGQVNRFQDTNIFHVVGMGEHVDRLDNGDTVAPGQ